MSFPRLSTAHKIFNFKRYPRYLQRLFENNLPHIFQSDAAVVQGFIEDEHRHTGFTLTNFPSFYAPAAASNCEYQLTAFDTEGEPFSSRKISLPPFGSRFLKFTEVFSPPFPRYGMVSAQIDLQPFFSFADRHLGVMTPQFFTLYFGAEMSSVALIHPQTRLGERPERNAHWRSQLLISPKALKMLEVLQINPSAEEVTSCITLYNGAEKSLLSAPATLVPRGARCVQWKVQDFRSEEYVVVGIDHLTTGNAKPLVFFNFPDGSFSACHT